MGVPKKPFTVDIPETWLYELRALARMQDLTVGWFIRGAIKQYLEPLRPIEVLDEDRALPPPRPKGGKQEPASIEAGFGDQEEK